MYTESIKTRGNTKQLYEKLKTETDAAEVYVEGSIARETISRNVAIWVGIIVHQSQFSFFIGGRVRIIS